MKNFRFLLTFSFFAVCLIFAGSHMTPAQQVQIAKNALEKENLATDTETDLPVTDAPAPAADPDKSARLDFNPLKRTGVQTAQTTPITLNDAIRRALENNNDIEVSRSL